MTQYQIWNFFHNNQKQWFSNELLSKKLKIKKARISSALRKLRKSGILYRNIRKEPLIKNNNVKGIYQIYYYKKVPKGYKIIKKEDNDEIKKYSNKRNRKL